MWPADPLVYDEGLKEPTPQHPCVERTVALIYEAFEAVSLGKGTSWPETDLMDGGQGHPDILKAARKEYKVARWQELVDDPGWEMSPGSGGFSFVNALGFRFYIAPAMIRVLRGDLGLDIAILLEVRKMGKKKEKYQLEKFSTLDGPQINAICQFIRCMMLVDQDYQWEESYESYWKALDGNDEARRDAPP